eukprot:4043965-Lingulodinium_polyedra.AAC.1
MCVAQREQVPLIAREARPVLPHATVPLVAVHRLRARPTAALLRLRQRPHSLREVVAGPAVAHH